MSRRCDQSHLLTRQYRDSSNLDARIVLHARFSTNPYGWFRWVFDRLDIREDARLLELGCGTARLWRENLERVPPGWDITLSDLSPGMLDDARATLHDAGRPFTFAVVDAQAIPFPTDSLDAVVANFMLYHVPDRPRALAEIRRVLRPGGRLFAATVSRRHLRELDDLVDTFVPETVSQVREENPITLESGGEQISTYFERVDLDRYEDSLVVNEVEPLVAYVLSMIGAETLERDRLSALIRHIEERIARDGAIRLTKDSGLFTAS